MSQHQTIVLPAHGLRVVPRRDVHGESVFNVYKDYSFTRVGVKKGEEYDVEFNPQSAVFIPFEDGLTLGLKPEEFDFVCPWFEKSETVLPRIGNE